MVRTRRDGGCAHCRTRNSELGVPLGSAEHGGRVARGLRGTLDVDPNPNGILPLHWVDCLVVTMGGTFHLFLRVCDSLATWLFRRSSTAIHRSVSVVCLWFRPVSFAGFFQIDIFESYPMVSLLLVVFLDRTVCAQCPHCLIDSSFMFPFNAC